MNAKQLSANVESCTNSIKNQAQELGADLILVNKDDPIQWNEGKMGCNNCIKVKGLAFKKKHP